MDIIGGGRRLNGAYAIAIDNEWGVCAYQYGNIASMVNDYRLDRDMRNHNVEDINCEFQDVGGSICLVQTKSILAQEEFLVDYGSNYDFRRFDLGRMSEYA